MIIIIEGADGSGKSTLAEKMSRQTGWPVVHMSMPKTDEEKSSMSEMYAEVIKANHNLIFDRCWYSEMAYGPTMRDESLIGYPDMYKLEELSAKKGAMIIYCTDKPDVLWKRCQRRGEDYVLHKVDFMEICEAFDEIMSVPHLIPVVKYGYKDL